MRDAWRGRAWVFFCSAWCCLVGLIHGAETHRPSREHVSGVVRALDAPLDEFMRAVSLVSII